MNFNNHSNLEGQHAFLGASKYHWINYSEDKVADAYSKFLATQKGTVLHAFAAQCISLGQKLPKSQKTLNMYVNDAIGYKMTPEQTLFYSENCFGTADSISYRSGLLRIHDLKTGIIPAHMEQLMIYAALFCLEYKVKPADIDTPEIVQAVFDILIACLQGIADNIGMVVQTAIDIVLNFIDGIAQKLPDVIQSGVNLLLSFIEGIISAIDNNSERLANDIRNLFKALIRAAVLVLTGGVVDIKEVGSKIMNSGLIKGIKDKLSNLKETVRDLISNAKQVIEDKIDSFKNIGKHLIGGFIGGIKDKASDLADSALDAVKGAVNGVKSFLGIHSPSRLFAQIGRYTDEGFINGVNGSGKGNLRIGDYVITISNISSYLTIDSELQDAYKGTTNCNSLVTLSNGFPKLIKGENEISFSGGITSVEVIPKWWTL